MVYYFHRENEYKQILLKYSHSDIDVSQTLYPGELTHRPNIHLIVLESFVDPRMLKGVAFDRSPLAEELEKYLHNSVFSTVISPVYGGLTAQAEFELLTGIPAYAKVNSIEFNVMNGSKIAGFLQQLIGNGYQTTASIATNESFFNAKVAYQSIGLQSVDFLGGNNRGFFGSKKTSAKVMFDGELFDINLKKIKKTLENSDAPVFNYVLGMYGHTPMSRDLALRPNVIHTNNLQDIANQFYYRTKALAQYIEQLLLIDPNSIIAVFSDHLPSISTQHRPTNRYSNIALLLNAGQYLDVSGKHQYEVPWLLWDLLLQKTNRRQPIVNLEELYYRTLAESMDAVLH